MAIKRTVRKDTGAVTLSRTELSNGAYLLYKLRVEGARGTFSLVDDKGRVLMADTGFPAPLQEYVRKWPKDPSEIPPERDVMHTLTISFIAATKYTYVVERHNAAGALIATLKDIDFESDDSSDVDYSGLRIFLVT